MLIFSVRQLGFKLGIMYFMAYLRALKDPDFVLEWADNCERHARKLEFFSENGLEAEACRSWAKELRNCHKQIRKFENKIDE